MRNDFDPAGDTNRPEKEQLSESDFIEKDYLPEL
jgi:hypothetical protein